MESCSSIDAVHDFFGHVWQSPPDWDGIDDLVPDDFVFISGGRRIEGREAFKTWAEDFIAAIANLEFEVVDSFEKCDGSQVASTWRLTGTNNGAFGTQPDGSPIEMTGSAIAVVRDGMLVSNRVERNAFEVYQQLRARRADGWESSDASKPA